KQITFGQVCEAIDQSNKNKESIEALNTRTADLERKTDGISNEDIETEDDNIVINDNEDNKVAEITKEGVKAKGYFDLNGNPIIDKLFDAYNTKQDGTSSYAKFTFIKGFKYTVEFFPTFTGSVSTTKMTNNSSKVDTFEVKDGIGTFVCSEFAFFINSSANKTIKIKEEYKHEKYNSKIYYPIISNLKQNSQGEANSIILAHISDIHGSETNTLSFMDFINQYKALINDAYCTGDIVSDEFTDSLGFWYKSKADGVLTCIGNHDSNDRSSLETSWYAISAEDCYKRFMVGYKNDDYTDQNKLLDTPMYQQWGVTLGGNNVCYYHKDYDNVRVITLDCMHYNEDQSAWLESVLNTDKHVLIMSHVRGENNYVSTANGFDCLDAKECTVWKQNNAVDIVQRFIDGGGKFIAWIAGHTHCDQSGWLKNYPSQFFVTISCAKDGNSEAAGLGVVEGVNRMINSQSQDCINLYSIDTTNMTLRVMRVGINVDRYLRPVNNMVYNYKTNKLI
ncbi:MAG: metallophosphoesterase, partial [Prevotellaceae bacterium]|nr:metallophosphoesterase [Candidatus Faecinaster equi]